MFFLLYLGFLFTFKKCYFKQLINSLLIVFFQLTFNFISFYWYSFKWGSFLFIYLHVSLWETRVNLIVNLASIFLHYWSILFNLEHIAMTFMSIHIYKNKIKAFSKNCFFSKILQISFLSRCLFTWSAFYWKSKLSLIRFLNYRLIKFFLWLCSQLTMSKVKSVFFKKKNFSSDFF